MPSTERSPARRSLAFASLPEVTTDVHSLLARHVPLGQWSLAQICHHLEVTIRLSMDGVPEKFSWPVRRFFGPVARRLSFRLSWIPEGVRVPAIYLPPLTELDASEHALRLGTTIERFVRHTGPWDEHPLLGRLTPVQWERFHRLHCAHHLSFVRPVACARANG